MIAKKFGRLAPVVPLYSARRSLEPPALRQVDPVCPAHLREVPRNPPAPELTRLLREASDRGLVIAIVPAHDDGAFIRGAIRWLAEQSSPPDLIVIRR